MNTTALYLGLYLACGLKSNGPHRFSVTWEVWPCWRLCFTTVGLFCFRSPSQACLILFCCLWICSSSTMSACIPPCFPMMAVLNLYSMKQPQWNVFLYNSVFMVSLHTNKTLTKTDADSSRIWMLGHHRVALHKRHQEMWSCWIYGQ